MTEQKFYRTVLQVEILSHEPYTYLGLGQAHEDIIYGDCSGRVSEVSSQEISVEELREGCEEHGTDVEFFLGELDDDLEEEA